MSFSLNGEEVPYPDSTVYSNGAGSSDRTAYVGADGPVTAEPEPRRRSKKLHPVVSIVAILIAGGIPALYLLNSIEPAPIAPVEDAVMAYDTAWATADCDLLWESTSAELREGIGADTCAAFVEGSQNFQETVSDYSVAIHTVEIRDDVATVWTQETYSTGSQYVTDEYVYSLELMDGLWTLVGVDEG